MACSGQVGPAGLEEFSRTRVKRVSSHAAEDNIVKTIATEALVAIQIATDCLCWGFNPAHECYHM